MKSAKARVFIKRNQFERIDLHKEICTARNYDKMKPFLNFCFLIITSVFFSSCAFAPVNNQSEKAATLKKGNFELAGSFSNYSGGGAGGFENTNNNFGARFGYGVTDRFDLKIRYEKLIPTDGFRGSGVFDEGDITRVNYFGVLPKFALVPQKLSLLVPVSHYGFKEQIEGKEKNGALNSIAPQILYTATSRKNKTDFSFGFKADCLFNDEGGAGVLLGTTLGAGFSSDLDKWAVRPEVGALFIAGGAFVSYGIGVQYMFLIKRK